MSDLTCQMIFSPQNCALDTLEATLTPKRHDLAIDLLGRIQDMCSASLACHNLVVGPRGSGKTHVLSYVRKRLERQWADETSPALIVLSEEQHAITRLLDFVVACIRALGTPAADAMARIRSAPRLQAADEAAAILRERLAKRGAVIFAENLDKVFNSLPAQAVDDLRAFFQNNPRVSLLGSSTALFAHSERPDHPFHGRFNPGPGIGLGYEDLKAIEAYHFLQSIIDGKLGEPSLAEAYAFANVNAAIMRSWDSGTWEEVTPL